MGYDREELYFCPPKLTAKYRLFLWDVYDLGIGLFILALGILWIGGILTVAGILYLVLKAYVTEEKSFYLLLKAIFLYLFTPQSYSQYIG